MCAMTLPEQRQTTEEITPFKQVSNQLHDESFRQQIAAALPEGVTVDRFARVTITALMEDQSKQKDPSKWLVNADRGSLYQSVLKCAQDGLLPDGREAALVVFGGKCQYMPMVGGFRKIAAEHGWTIRSNVVYENDEFDYTVEPPTLLHRPVRPGQGRGELVAAYAVARHRDGRQEQRVMYRDEIMKRKQVSKTDVVWKAWEAEMWAKTPTKDLFAELSLDPAEKERVTRMLAADLSPEEATRAMYGRDAISQVSSATVVEERQQAPDAAHSPAAPEATGTAGAQDETLTDDERIQRDADEAAKFVPPEGQHAAAGRTLADILAQGDPGIAWIKRWIGEPELNEKLRDALFSFTRVYLPDVYEQAMFDRNVEF